MEQPFYRKENSVFKNGKNDSVSKAHIIQKMVKHIFKGGILKTLVPLLRY